MKRLRAALFGCLGMVGTALAQDLAAPVTLDLSGKSAKVAIAEIARQTGVKLAVIQTLEDAPLYIHVRQAPLKDLMDRVATVLQGTWSLEADGTRRLIKAKETPEDESKRMAERILRFTKLQQKMRQELAGRKPFDRTAAQNLIRKIEEHIRAVSEQQQDDGSFYEKGNAIGKLGPLDALARSVFVEIDPKVLAGGNRDRRLVWSSQPTRMQLPLPAKASASIQKFADELKLFQNEVGSRTFKYPENHGLPPSIYYLIQRNFDWNDTLDLSETEGPISKLLVIGRSYSNQGIDQIEVKLANQKGVYIAVAALDVGMYSAEAREADGNRPENEFDNLKKLDDPNEKPITLSPLSRAFVERGKVLFASEGGGTDPTALDPALEKALLEPEKTDPTWYVFGDSVRQVAEAMKLQVVASPADFMSMFLAYLDIQDMNRPSQFVRALKSQMLGTDLKIENGWLTLGPKSNTMGAPEGSGKRLDRKLLGNLLRSIKQHGMLLIDVAADYAAQSDPALGRGESLAGLFVRLLWPDQGGALDQFDPTWLKLYGSMNPTQRRQLLAGEKVPLRQLTAQQRALVETAVFGAEPYSMRYEPKGENQDWEVFHNGLRGEPTERYPNGLPPDAYLQVAEKREPVVFATGMHEGKYQMTTYLDVSNLAHHLFAQQNPQIYGGDYRGPEYTAFQPFDQRELEFAVRLDPEVAMMGQLHERRSIGKRVTSIDQLPADFLAKVQAARKTLEEQHKQSQPPPR